jgi:serine/threonine protein kinase
MSETARDLTDELVDRRFRVERKLGSGGMGTVWQVQHVESLQRFALKTLAAEFVEDRASIDRFLREARAAAVLRTRHVVRMIDVQMGYEHEGKPLPFIVMELLEGFDLEHLVRARGRLSPAELVWLVRQVGRALGVAHARGVVHRDLKAANVFVALDEEREPIAKLCDFGIAKLVGDSALALARTGEQTTRTGAFLGTPMYMAPEQLVREGMVVPATDQWALALIAFRVLTGIEYFGQATTPADLVVRIVRDPLPPPSSLDPELTSEFDAWFLRSCARDPRARYPSVDEQIERLGVALGNPTPEPLVPRLVPHSAIDSQAVERAEVRSTSPLVGRPRGEPRGVGRVIAVGALTIAALVGIYAVAGSWFEGAIRASLGHPPVLSVPMPGASAVPAVIATDVASAVASEPHQAPSAAPSQAPERQSAAPFPTRRQRTPRTTAATTAAAPASSLRPPATRRRAKGEACASSAECESGLCLAEACR